jgi:hypothetical protein
MLVTSPIHALAGVVERYHAVRLEDVPSLIGQRHAISYSHLKRLVAQQVAHHGFKRVPVAAQTAIVLPRPANETTLIHCVQWSMLDAALLADGYQVSRGDDARAAIRSWLLQQPHPTGTDTMFAAAARRSAADMPLNGPDLPYSAAWKGPPSAPTDLRLVVVLAPRLSQKKQLEALPLRIAGQPKIPVILRPADDGTMAHHKTGALTYIGPQYRALMRAFREHRNPGTFPYWETAEVLNYRPDLWARLDRTHQ